MIRNHRIDYIEFQSSDPAASRAFFERAFGWRFVDYGPDYTSFEAGAVAGGTTGGFRRGPAATAGSGPLTVIYADDLLEAERRVRACGAPITTESFRFPGGARFHFREPGGNELAVWHEDAAA